MPGKSTKDSNAPKKPLSAYILFSADERPKLKASGLDNFAEMSKALGSAWKQADQKTRSHYEKEHEREKVRYENELKDYQKSGKPAPSSMAAQKGKPATKSTPAKPTSKAAAAAAPKPTAKKNVPAEESDDDDEKENDDDDEDEESEEEESEEEEEEEQPAPPAKNPRKKN